MHRFRRPSHATVVAYLALFVALGGSSYAAAKIGSKQIKNNSIQSKDIKNGTVAGKDVKNGSLAADDFKAGNLPTGPKGTTGARGLTGPRGLPGSALGYAHVRKNGTLDTAHSKGVIGVSPACFDSGSGGAGTPPNCFTGARDPESDTSQCLKLSFTPANAVVTPEQEALTTPNTVASVQIPAQTPTAPFANGCGVGYRGAEVFTSSEAGFYVVFN